MNIQPARKIETLYRGLAVIVLAILCSCTKDEAKPVDLHMLAKVHTGYHDYAAFVGANQ